MSTERLYYRDSRLIDFTASLTGSSDGGRRLYLDRTAFYPSSGGQPNDTGSLNGIRITDVVDEEDGRIAHLLAAPLEGVSDVRGSVDWVRRFDHMQQHTGQHLLSAVLAELCGAQTVGFHLSADYATIDLAVSGLDAVQIAAAETRANDVVFENRPVAISFEDAASAPGLRKPSDRQGELRIITIQGFDRSACGGTHVSATGEIGPILIRKVERAHQSVRLEFLCGMRAIRRARADFDALTKIARTFSSPVDETPAIAAAQSDALAASEKARRKLAVELAHVRGRELYLGAEPAADGLRRHELRIAKGALDDEIRATAQGFVSNPKALFLAIAEEPPALLLAVSPDSGIHAGNALKAALTANGGRGGGSQNVGQGSVPSREKLDLVRSALP